LVHFNHSESINQVTQVLTGDRMEDLAWSPVDGEKISRRDIAGILQPEVEDIPASHYVVMPGRLIVAGYLVHKPILRSRSLD